MTEITLAVALVWMRDSVGRFYNPDNAHGFQCKDWADAFCLFLFGSWVNTIRPGNGADVFDNANPEFFIKVRNDPNRPDQLPPPGSIVSIAGSAAVPEGHVAGVLGADAGGMDVVQMNGYTQTAAHRARLTYDGLIGWLIPKYATQFTTQEVGKKLTPEQDYMLRQVFAVFFNKKDGKGDNASIVGGEALDDLINKNDLGIIAEIRALRAELAATKAVK
jgi:hypothetical protein